MITERQSKILNALIREYIESAEPVGSKFLDKKCKFNVCPATIRNEMQKLTDMGYICQLHTSAGRVPTAKGYRFFVEQVINSGDSFSDDSFIEDIKEIERESENEFRFAELIAKTLAAVSSSLVFAYLPEKDFLWKEGWKEILRNPEFREADFLEDFADVVDSMENTIKEFAKDKNNQKKIEVYIGKEKAIPNLKGFSLIVSRNKFPENEDGFLAFLGPQRMAYDKNISIFNSLLKELDNL